MAGTPGARATFVKSRDDLRNGDDLRTQMEDSAAANRPSVVGLPQGYTSRPLTVDDLAAVYDLEAAGETFDDGVVEVELSDLEGDWRRPDFDPAGMSVGLFQGDDLVAYATVFKGRAEALVHPDHRGRGMGSALMRWTWEAARADGRDRVGQTISENERTAETLLRAHEYGYGHTSWVLSVELADDKAPPPPALPEGYRFHPFHAGIDDRDVFTVIDTAFEEWRGSTSESLGFENWVASSLHELKPGLIVLIVHGDRIVGVAIGCDYGPGSEGWIQQVAVEKAHRGQGLGRALLEESFRRLWDIGRRRCAVSTDSRTGALSLYEHVGMSVRRSYTRWMKQGL
jgi:mycothiol synthase